MTQQNFYILLLEVCIGTVTRKQFGIIGNKVEAEFNYNLAILLLDIYLRAEVLKVSPD